MRYDRKTDTFYRPINYANHDERTALWIMHHATQALLDALLTTSALSNEEMSTLDAIVKMAHKRIDTLTAI